MKVVSFIAENPAAALAQIHERLGPEAVVLSVRPVPASGLARLWQKNRAVEVLAGVAEPEEANKDESAKSLDESIGQLPDNGPSFDHVVPAPQDGVVETPRAARQFMVPRSWRSLDRLETMGLLPVFADRLEEHLSTRYGAAPPSAPAAEWEAILTGLTECWRCPPPLHDEKRRPHVLIGPPGVGKTTLLCKWLATSVLLEQRATQVWRLDGSSANTAELLDIYGEMFGLTVERFWRPTDTSADLLLVDLPGVEANDAQALSALKEQLATLPSPRVHLVLNAAYDTPILFENFRAFAPFHPEDVSFTHLDEEKRRAKLWNFVLGTTCPLRFFSVGQKIPGDFCLAEAPRIARQSKTPENMDFCTSEPVCRSYGKGSA